MADEVVRKTTTRKRTVKTTARKAPVRSTAVEERSRNYTPLIVAVVLIVFIGGTAAIGFSDSGQINVSNTINDRKTGASSEEQVQMQNIPVQQSRPSQPLGGLVPSKDEDLPKPPPPQVESSASSSATSSDSAETGTEEATEETASDETTETTEEVTPTETDTSSEPTDEAAAQSTEVQPAE